VLGGGSRPRPGEVTLAHRGVLFLDELPEFRREVLEGLRQPLEDRRITIGRAECTLTMPADFLLAAAMNPCPCGFEGDPRRPCTCPPPLRLRYRARVSGPLLDRFDLLVPVPAIDVAAWDAPLDPALSTAALRAAIETAVERQRERGCANGRLDGPLLECAGACDTAARRAIAAVVRRERLAGRARVRILRVARTLADLADADRIRDEHVLDAARLRSGALSAFPAG
jgi:magnesium chelatase family protein